MGNQRTNELWHRFKSGDDDALSKLYNLYVHKLFSYGLKINGDEYLVKDCIQEVFIQLIDKRKTLIPSDSTSIYLFKSLRNKLLEELRSKNRRMDIAKSILFGDEMSEMSAEQSIVSSEEVQLRAKIIENALNALSDHQKEAIFLKYSQGFDYKKIAEILEIDIASARTLIYRSLKLVKRSINSKTPILLFFFHSLL